MKYKMCVTKRIW